VDERVCVDDLDRCREPARIPGPPCGAVRSDDKHSADALSSAGECVADRRPDGFCEDFRVVERSAANGIVNCEAVNRIRQLDSAKL
jgi:hypothetical protein